MQKKVISATILSILTSISLCGSGQIENKENKSSDSIKITKVVIPAAGLGTRFLPYTKSIPKEMLPLLDKPTIQYVIEESLKCDLNDIIIITNKSKHALEHYFDSDLALDITLKEKHMEGVLSDVKKIIKNSSFTYVRQYEPLGLGHAVLTTKHLIEKDEKEYFCVVLPDLIMQDQPGLDEIIKIAKNEKACVIAVQEVPMERVSSYGIVSIKQQISPELFQVESLVEKPSIKNAPSNLAIIGRYVFSSKIFDSLEKIGPDAKGELQLTNAINHMLQSGQKVFAYKMRGPHYDTGTPIEWLKATISCALANQNYAPEIRKFLSEIDLQTGNLRK